MTTSAEQADIAILGAGVTAGALAQELMGAGQRVMILDKARGPGGRTSTRRAQTPAGTVQADHGAQFFTARGAAFRQALGPWIESGAVQSWEGPFLERHGTSGAWTEATPGAARWVGVPGMNQLPRLLMGSTPTRFGARVTEVSADRTLTLENGEVLGPFKLVLSTLPAPQAAALLPRSSAWEGLADRCSFDPCITWIAQLHLDDPPAVAAWRDREAPVGWIAQERTKPGRSGSHTWVLQMSPQASLDALESGESAWRPVFLSALEEVLGRPPHIQHEQFHRWRFAQGTLEPMPTRAAMFDPDLGIGLAGDWLGGRRIEAAFDSGQALATLVQSALS